MFTISCVLVNSRLPFSDMRPHSCRISRMQLSLYLPPIYRQNTFKSKWIILLPQFLCMWTPFSPSLWLWPRKWLPVSRAVLLLKLLQGRLLLPHHHREAVFPPNHLPLLLLLGGKEDLASANSAGVHFTCGGVGALGGVAPGGLHHLRQQHRQHLPQLRHLHPILQQHLQQSRHQFGHRNCKTKNKKSNQCEFVGFIPGQYVIQVHQQALNQCSVLQNWLILETDSDILSLRCASIDLASATL